MVGQPSHTLEESRRLEEVRLLFANGLLQDLAPSELVPSELAPSELAPSELAASELAPKSLRPNTDASGRVSSPYTNDVKGIDPANVLGTR